MEALEVLLIGAELIHAALEVADFVCEVSPRRLCTIHVTNFSDRYVLENSGTYTCRGRCVDPFPPRILPSSSGSAVFIKKHFTGRGFFGVVTFDLFDTSTQKTTEQMAVLFKVPHNLQIKSNLYAVEVFDSGRMCDKNLFKKMLDDANMACVKGHAEGSPLMLRKPQFSIRAMMSDCLSPVIKVHVSTHPEDFHTSPEKSTGPEL